MWGASSGGPSCGSQQALAGNVPGSRRHQEQCRISNIIHRCRLANWRNAAPCFFIFLIIQCSFC